jgi:hypothetical protein
MNDQAVTVKIHSDDALTIFTVRFTVKNVCFESRRNMRVEVKNPYLPNDLEIPPIAGNY